jgi:hypothetical protein
MFKAKFKRYLFYLFIYMFGVFSISLLQYIATFARSHQVILSQGDIGDINIWRESDMKKESVDISQGDYPILQLSLNKFTKEIEKVSLLDGNNRVLGRFYLSDGRFNGVEILSGQGSPMFQMNYLKEKGKWGGATYGKWINDKIYGECYYDLNCDGMFDSFSKFDNSGKYEYQSIFFNGNWNAVVSNSKDYKNAQIIMNDEKKEKLDLVFDFDEGWMTFPRL